MTSQDSSPRSSTGSDSSEEWTLPPTLDISSPSHHHRCNNIGDRGTNNVTSNMYGQETGGADHENSNSDSSCAMNNNVAVMTTITNVADPKLEAASAERRQDRSSPIHLAQPQPAAATSFSSLDSSSASSGEQHQRQPTARRGPSRDNRRQREQEQLQVHRQQQIRKQKQNERQIQPEEWIKRENEALQKECEELESILLQNRTEGNLIKMRTALKLRNYETEIRRATNEKEKLVEHCRGLEDQIWRIRKETRLKQESIWNAEEALRLQQQRQQPSHKSLAEANTGAAWGK